MNAIILAAGNSSRMYESGGKLPKGLLPILGIPNIERTILMLHMIDIYEIIIAVPCHSSQFDYLAEKYSCTIINVPPENRNTLTSMNYLLEYIDDSFIIEGDVVCSKNIFRPFEYSTYYVMRYVHPECDEWNVVMDSYDNIIGFEFGTHRTPAIFGISFWTQKDCPLLKAYLRLQLQYKHANDIDFFWDDNISELLEKICLKAYEIDSDTACEMNTISEYQYAINLCKKMLMSPDIYFNNSYVRKANINFLICSSSDKEMNLKWLEKLFAHYNESLFIKESNNYDYWYSPKESVYIIKNNKNQEAAFFSFIIEKKFILLRRLFIDSSFRAIGLGKEVLNYLQLFALSCNKELRVNVYDEMVADFYVHTGAEKLFSTYHWKLLESNEGYKDE